MKRWLIMAALTAVAMGQQVNTDVVPANPGLNIGHSNQRWNGFFQNMNILGTCTFNGGPCFGGGGGNNITLQTNGVNNSSQSLLNIVNGNATTATNVSGGQVSINFAVGSPNNAVQYNCSGILCGDSSFTFNPSTKALTVSQLTLGSALYLTTTCGAATPPATTASTTVFAVGADCNPYWSNNGGAMTRMNQAGSGVTGSGTTGNLAEWTSSSSIGNSPIVDSGGTQLRVTIPVQIPGTGVITGNALNVTSQFTNCIGSGSFTRAPDCFTTETTNNPPAASSGNGTALWGFMAGAGVTFSGTPNLSGVFGEANGGPGGGTPNYLAGTVGWGVGGTGGTAGHIAGVVGIGQVADTQVATVLEGGEFSASTVGSATTPNAYGVHVLSPTATTGTLTHYYGIFVEDPTTGGVHNSDPHGITVAAGGVTVQPHTFSTLPTCNAAQEGRMEAVSDDNTAVAWGATITGGGTNHVGAYCDGTNWTIYAK